MTGAVLTRGRQRATIFGVAPRFAFTVVDLSSAVGPPDGHDAVAFLQHLIDAGPRDTERFALIADRFGRRRVIAASLFIWSVVTWWTGHVTTFHELMTARAMMGISEAFLHRLLFRIPLTVLFLG